MAVEDAEETDLGPLDLLVAFVLGLEDIQNYAHPVFVVVSDDALVRVGRV